MQKPKYTIAFHCHKSSRGFTIVELLVVVIVIAILAAIVTIAYNGIQTRAAQAIVKDSLANVATAMKAAAVEISSFDTIPSNVKIAEGVGVALTELTPPATSSNSFCANGVHSKYTSIRYHITETGPPQEGFCSGSVIEESIVGTYPDGILEESLGYVPIEAKTVHGDKYNFTVTANEAWTQVTLSWDPQPGAVKYEVQTRNATNGDAWAYRALTTGASTSNSCGSSSCTVPSATTSLTWTNTLSAVPSGAGRTYEYQLRSCTTAGSTDCSEWSVASLANPIQADSPIPKVASFTVTPAHDWSNVVLAWSPSPRFAALQADQKYEIQSRRKSTDAWTYRSLATGASTTNSCSSSSCTIPTATTSLAWADASAVPTPAGYTYEYRIRACVTGVALYCGDWKETSLANPVQSNADVPDIAGFTVIAAPDWSSVTLSWTAAEQYIPHTTYKYEVQSRRNSSEEWAYRSLSTGASSTASCSSTSCTVTRTTTSLIWTNATYAIPSAGQTFEYRIRNCSDSASTFCGNWSTKTLSR